VPEQHSRRGSPKDAQPDLKADKAAQKVRRTAKLRDTETLSEAEKSEAATKEFEAHAELERSKRYKGQPDRS
jgi:hypothetical protein